MGSKVDPSSFVFHCIFIISCCFLLLCYLWLLVYTFMCLLAVLASEYSLCGYVASDRAEGWLVL